MDEYILKSGNYETLKFVLKFFIRAKDECVDKFILFNEEAANFSIDVADTFQKYAYGDETPQAIRLRVFSFHLKEGDALLLQMQDRLLDLIIRYDDIAKYLSEEENPDGMIKVLKSYLAPFSVNKKVLSDFSNRVMEVLKRRSPILGQ